ncbi:MAG: hypothetical protein ACLF0G_07680 [Candidatus Brocadiia bacterium]
MRRGQVLAMLVALAASFSAAARQAEARSRRCHPRHRPLAPSCPSRFRPRWHPRVMRPVYVAPAPVCLPAPVYCPPPRLVYRPVVYPQVVTVARCPSPVGGLSILLRSLLRGDTGPPTPYPPPAATTVSARVPQPSQTPPSAPARPAPSLLSCPRCDGAGHLVLQGDWGPVKATCPRCGGRGYLASDGSPQPGRVEATTSLPLLPR